MENLKTHDEILPEFIHPWNIEVFDEQGRDNRYFAILINALLFFLDNTVKMYNKPVRHFILHTGKEYLYQENNGYEYSLNTTTGEDYPYFHKPRGIIRWDKISITENHLSSPFAEGLYERCINTKAGKNIKEFQSEIRILPISIPVELTYILSNFNESIVMSEQILNKFAFTRYFSYSYLGRTFDCSIEFPKSLTPGKTIKVGYDAETKDRELNIELELKTSFPVISEITETDSSKLIADWTHTITPDLANT